ncbi:MAG: peptidoglycan-binding protein [Marmoricola sp.]|nr:peptidoglycan-binding protein [Marmoricola sp.]
MLAVATLTTTFGSLAPAGAATTPSGGSAGDPPGTTVLLSALRAVAAPVAVPRAPVATAGSTPEALAAYVPANSCDPTAKPGTTALGELLKATYAGSSYGIDRTCGTDPLPTSEHYDGRALDFFRSVRDPQQKAQVQALVSWLFATDAHGNPYANARRLGVMYLIWNNRIWGSYRASDGWRPYAGCASRTSRAYDTTCHRDHVHLSLSWEGAMKRTSFWTRQVAAVDYGPCREAGLNWAAPYTTARTAPCPSLPRVTAPAGSSALRRTLTTYSGMVLTRGDAGPVVRAVQQAVHTTVDGSFGPMTQAAVRTWQAAHGVTPTGVVAADTWHALLRAVAVAKPAVAAKPTHPELTRYRSRTLAVGSHGPAVVALQKRLWISHGGTFGPATRTRVRTFQRRHGLPTTGVVAARTWAALGA